MSINASYVISYSLFGIISFFVFLLCLIIYKNTKGASLAYKKWATGTFILLISCLVPVITGIAFECNETDSTDKNEVNAIIVYAISSIGYFYIPVGIMYLSKDFGVGNVNENLIKKVQIIFYSLISLISIFAIVLFPFFEILSFFGFTLNLLHSLIWVISIFFYNEIYKQVLKPINRCWLFIYIGIIGGFISEIFNTIAFIIPVAETIGIIFQLIMAAGFISGFFKLAKMVEAI